MKEKKITNTSKSSHLEWLMGGNPDAIEAQEAQGQKELVESSQLPRKCNYPRDFNAIEQYKKMGIKVVENSEGDDLFVDVVLPKGWKLEFTDHSMWNSLIDNKGRERATIFYKAAFYDRDAFINFNQRIHFRIDRLGFIEGNYERENGVYVSQNTPFVGRVTDYDESILFETEQIKCDVEFVDYEGRQVYSEEYKEKSREAENKLKTSCLEYLKKNYPEYEDINAYWD